MECARPRAQQRCKSDAALMKSGAGVRSLLAAPEDGRTPIPSLPAVTDGLQPVASRTLPLRDEFDTEKVSRGPQAVAHVEAAASIGGVAPVSSADLRAAQFTA